MRNRQLKYLAVLLIFTALIAQAETIEIFSPDRNIRVKFILQDGKPYYSVTGYDHLIIQDSRLGFEIKGQSTLSDNFKSQP